VSLLTLIFDGKVLFTGTVTPTNTTQPPGPADPPPPPPPPPPTGDNPFVAWKAEGLTLYDVILYRLHHGLSEREWEQAVAAGYASEAGLRPTGGGPAMPEGTDLTGTEGGGGRRNNFQANAARTFTFTAPRDGPAYITVEVNPGEMTATRVSVISEAGIEVRDLKEWQRFDFSAVAGRNHAFTVAFDGKATAAVTVRYA
jgi:hypothetical protein